MRKIPIVVDPKVEHFSYYKGVDGLTPNHLEATQAAGVHGEDDQAINEAGAMIRQRLGCQAVLITRGEKGMSVYEGDGASWHIPTHARQVYDVTGAGDTVIGTLALALSTGATMRDAATSGQPCGRDRRRHGRHRNGVGAAALGGVSDMTKATRSVTVVIPARYGSSRFPGKPLVMLAGKPMIQHVYEQAAACRVVTEVLVATDDERIKQAVEAIRWACRDGDRRLSDRHRSGCRRGPHVRR